MNVNDIIAAIKENLKPVFEKQLESRIDRLRVLIKERTREGKYGQIKNVYQRHAALEADGFTKRDLNLAASGLGYAREQYEKDAKNSLLKIDVAVIKKLSKVEVVSVEPNSSIRTGYDGFIEGSWIINTAGGPMVFSFETILAGGYNIQCLHVRTLYRLKKLKVEK